MYKENFCQICFPLTSDAVDTGFDVCDQEPGGECECCGPRGQPCGHCMLCISPFAFVTDIICMVPRFGCFVIAQCTYYDNSRASERYEASL